MSVAVLEQHAHTLALLYQRRCQKVIFWPCRCASGNATLPLLARQSVVVLLLWARETADGHWKSQLTRSASQATVRMDPFPNCPFLAPNSLGECCLSIRLSLGRAGGSSRWSVLTQLNQFRDTLSLKLCPLSVLRPVAKAIGAKFCWLFWISKNCCVY